MKQKRLKRGEWKAMSPEKQQEWKRFLQRRWRHNHPDKVAEQNKFYGNLYRQTKPFVCVCKICHNEFNAARAVRNTCDACLEKAHKRRQTEKQAILARKESHQLIIKNIIKLWKTGVSQSEIARRYSRTQSGISALLRRRGIIKKTLDNKKTK